jgi:MFS family permease
LVIARVSIIGFAGFFLGPPVIGLLAEFHGLRVAFATVGCFLLMILPATMMLKRQGPKALSYRALLERFHLQRRCPPAAIT